MIDSHTSPTLPHPIPSLANNVVSSSGTCQTTSSHTATITETTPVKATTASQQNGTVSFCIHVYYVCTIMVYTVYTSLCMYICNATQL